MNTSRQTSLSIRSGITAITLVSVLVASACPQEPIGKISDAQVILKNNIKLASRNSGIVVSIQAMPGDSIGMGEVIVRLDSDVYQAELAVALSQFELANLEEQDDSEIEYAETSKTTSAKILERTEKAKKEFEKSVSNSEIDKQTLDRAQARFTFEQARLKKQTKGKTKAVKENEQILAKLAMDYREIRSPIEALVVEIPVQVGEWVNSGQVVARVVDLKHLRIETFVPLELAGQLRRNQKTEFETKLGSKTVRVSGAIRFVSPEINPVNQDFKVWVDFENAEMALFPGMVGDLILYGGK